MNCSRHTVLKNLALEKLASALVSGATMELYLTPKPGLVDCIDSGSHADLSLALMEQSIRHVADYLDEMALSLKIDEAFASQQSIAIRAERRLFDELGTNTHKGYLFLSGMLLIASWQARSLDEQPLRQKLSMLAKTFFRASESIVSLPCSHGQAVRRKFNAGGIVQEAIDGYPSLFDTALPAYRAVREQGGCKDTASFAMLARLMQVVDDTTTLHRGGLAGLARIKRDGRRLERIIAQGEDCRPFLIELNRLYVRMNLTIGGVADMLGIGYGYLIASGEIAAEDQGALGKAA